MPGRTRSPSEDVEVCPVPPPATDEAKALFPPVAEELELTPPPELKLMLCNHHTKGLLQVAPAKFSKHRSTRLVPEMLTRAGSDIKLLTVQVAARGCPARAPGGGGGDHPSC